MKTALVLLSLSFLALSCRTKAQEDPRVVELQKEVARLSEEQERQAQSLEDLRREISQAQTKETPAAPQTAVASARPTMTMDRMKAGVQPELEEVIRKFKSLAETPKKGEQFGMRIEYDVKNAVYGLIQNRDERAPYSARVIVKYEKFLESQSESRSYGTGSQQFYFVYRNQKWVHEERQ